MKTTLFYFICCFYLCLLTACNYNADQPPYDRIDITQLPAYALVIDTLTLLPDGFTPEIHMINDTMVLITNQRDASHLRIYYTNSDNIKSYHLKSKNDSIQISQDTSLYASLHFLNKANRVYYDFQIKKGSMKIRDFHRLRIGERSPKEAVKAEENIYVGIGTYVDGLFSSFNTEARSMDYYGNYPLKEERYLYKHYLPYFTGFMDMREDQAVYVSENFGYISSYQYFNEEGKLRKTWDKQLTEFQFMETSTGIKFEPDHQWGFQGVKIKEKHIYALYNGSLENDPIGLKNSVLVFDRQGEGVAHYLFPDMVKYITIDEQEKYIYGVFTPFMNETWLIRFRIPD